MAPEGDPRNARGFGVYSVTAMKTGRVADEWPILVVDDEDSYRRAVAQMLTRAGYKVAEAADGRAAYEIARQAGGCLSAVICDVHMPRMSGCELSARLHAEYPDLRILFMSGYPTEALHCAPYFIAKPFTRSALLATLREMLSVRPEPRSDESTSADPEPRNSLQ